MKGGGVGWKCTRNPDLEAGNQVSKGTKENDEGKRTKKNERMEKERMMKRTMGVVSVVAVAWVCVSNVLAGGVTYKNEDGDYMKLGGRIQLQYHMTDVDDGDSTDDLLFRRLRPYIEGSVQEDWKGKFQFDFGKGRVAVKDAYLKYSGFDGVGVTIGNANACFSRELLTSSKYQQLVERTFVGDHNYGTPDRQAGVHLGGKLFDGVLAWNAVVAKAAIDPSNSKLDFDTVIQHEAGDDWLQGNLYGGRVEYYPLGAFKASQGDFKRNAKAAVAVGAFGWNNDDDHVNMDVDEVTAVETVSHSDVDSVTGIEVSGAFRFAGLSIDAQLNLFDSELVNGKAGADGIYEDGETTLTSSAIEAGYMVVPSFLEVVAGYQAQDADGYAEAWRRASIGANYFVAKHDIKYQLTYRMGENKDGKEGNDVDELFVQAQYVF